MSVDELIIQTKTFLNNVQIAHWQTESYSEHEALGELYDTLDKLNDKLTETYQGSSGLRVDFSKIKIDLHNYRDSLETIKEVKSYKNLISKTSSKLSDIEKHKLIDIESILEDMMIVTSQCLYHLTLK